ncbi:MAG: hypothetical protein LBL95_07490 [Deltaproteobacteria bacterium]|jgi:valyl-tRNA synthetase|nr:hypothetical protein [Deltaproteobacteria bacterium]
MLATDITAASSKMANAGYLAKAPEDVVSETRDRLAALEDRLAAVRRALGVVGAISGSGTGAA